MFLMFECNIDLQLVLKLSARNVFIFVNTKI